MSRKKYEKKILSVLTQNCQSDGLGSIDKALCEKFAENERKHKEAAELAGLACLSHLDLDPRGAETAVGYFITADRPDLLAELYRMAKLRRHFRLVWLAGSALDLPGWKQGFKVWFKRHGVWWFDLFEDQAEGIVFIHPDDVRLVKEISLALGLDDGYWSEIGKQAETRKDIPSLRRRLAKLLAENKEPAVRALAKDAHETDAAFRRFCSEQGIRVLRCLQEGSRGISGCSWVYQALDTDGVIKIFKEVIAPYGRRFRQDSEEAVYAKLGEWEFLPVPHQAEKISGKLRFLRQPFIYGRSLAPIVASRTKLDVGKAEATIAAAAAKLEILHRSGVAHLDLRPEHIVINSDGLSLLDLGLSRIVPNRLATVDIMLRSPRYAAPEMGLHGRGGCSSDIFQLGIIFFELLTGCHPFCLHERLPEGDAAKGAEAIKYLLPAMTLEFDGSLLKGCDEKIVMLVASMLDKDPLRRPTAREVVEVLQRADKPPIPSAETAGNVSRRNTVLFPARMSIPHRGHIEYIARLAELGYHVKISLQCSYILTEHDPVPKWLTMKMVAQSLFDRGIGPEHFEFIFTPLYATRKELELHFRMMPGWEDIVAIASGNPEVHALFPDMLILDQKSVFGREGECYETRSWGESLRQAIRDGNELSFRKLAGSGAERILSFDELRQELMLRQPIDFVSGRVSVILIDSKDKVMTDGRVYRYLSPEESLCQQLRNIGQQASIVDPYAKDTIMLINGKLIRLKYRHTDYENGNEAIVFEASNPG